MNKRIGNERIGEVRIGEVIQASITGFTAQCHALGEPPPLGSLVKTADGATEIFAIVCDASTGSMDPGRRFTALGQDEATEEGVYRSHPELAQLLCTNFQALVVSHRVGDVLHQRLSPRPARIHAFVGLAGEQDVRDISGRLEFLPKLANAPIPTRDDALAAALRLASLAHADPEAFLLRAGKELAALLSRDTQRLNTILRLLRG